MIHIGLDDEQKTNTVRRYCTDHGTAHVVTISPEKCPWPCPEHDNVTYEQAIMYVTFYRLLQEIDNDTLVVLNECLRTQNRYDLTYNCIRHYLAQTRRQIVFQHLPQIDERDDFMILFDFDTQSRWKQRRFDLNLVLDNASIVVSDSCGFVSFNPVPVRTPDATKRRYQVEKERRFRELGARDPHTLPRNLYLIGGKDKKQYIKDRQNTGQLSFLPDTGDCCSYVARNKRLQMDGVATYRDLGAGDAPFAVLEFPHRFIEFGDFMRQTRQHQFDVLVADLPVDKWYFDRYSQWGDRINETCASLREG